MKVHTFDKINPVTNESKTDPGRINSPDPDTKIDTIRIINNDKRTESGSKSLTLIL